MTAHHTNIVAFKLKSAVFDPTQNKANDYTQIQQSQEKQKTIGNKIHVKLRKTISLITVHFITSFMQTRIQSGRRSSYEVSRYRRLKTAGVSQCMQDQERHSEMVHM